MHFFQKVSHLNLQFTDFCVWVPKFFLVRYAGGVGRGVGTQPGDRSMNQPKMGVEK